MGAPHLNDVEVWGQTTVFFSNNFCALSTSSSLRAVIIQLAWHSSITAEPKLPPSCVVSVSILIILIDI